MIPKTNVGLSMMSTQDDEPDSLRLRQRILRAGWWTGGGFLLDKVIAAVQLAVLVRILTPADFGVMAASAAVLLAMLTISELGLESALVAKEIVSEDDLAAVWTLSVARGLLMAMGIWSIAGVVGEIMRMPTLESLLRVHAWALIIQGFQSPVLALMLKKLDLRRKVAIDVVRRIVEAVVTLTIAILYRTVWALVIGQLVGLTIGSLLSFRIAPFTPGRPLKLSAFSYFVRYGRHLNLTTLCAFGVMTGGELVIGRLLGLEALGFYQVALTIPLLIGARATALMQQISVPTYASLQRDQLGLIRVFDLQMGLMGIVYIPLAVAIGALTPIMVPIVFGPQWTSISDSLQVFCVYSVCAGYASVMASLHYGLGRPDLQVKSWVAQGALYLTMIVPMTVSLGLFGAAVSLTASYILGTTVQVLETRKLLGVSTDGTFLSLGRTGLFGLVAGALLWTGVGQTHIAIPWTPEILAMAATGVFGWYLWRVERPRLKTLWNYQSQAGA
ncbi:MAG: oligosaccharide flippase family protein [Nitrospira sp.]|nr:oligosaccharide flippase family protein [Nitrospira sp.]